MRPGVVLALTTLVVAVASRDDLDVENDGGADELLARELGAQVIEEIEHS